MTAVCMNMKGMPKSAFCRIVDVLIHPRFGAYMYTLCGQGVFTHFSQTNKLVAIRRKFGSQTSDDMDRWKSKGGKSQRRERVSRKKMQVRQKVEKSRTCFLALEARQVGLLKRRGCVVLTVQGLFCRGSCT